MRSSTVVFACLAILVATAVPAKPIEGVRFAGEVRPGDAAPRLNERASNATPFGTIDGADFAAAVIAVWLGPKAIDDSLKTQLLGRS